MVRARRKAPTRNSQPVVVPAFGAELVRARKARNLEPKDVLRHLRSLRVACSPAAFSRYEAGQRQAPDPVVLHALAKLYDVRIESWLQLLWAERAGKPLTTAVEGIGMLVSGPEEHFVRLFRALRVEDQRFVMQFIDAKSREGGGATKLPDGFRPSTNPGYGDRRRGTAQDTGQRRRSTDIRES